jgi:hypothetical protein
MFGWGKKPEKAPEPPVEEFPGEAEKVMKVKNLCWIAKMSTEAYGEMTPEEQAEEFGQTVGVRLRPSGTGWDRDMARILTSLLWIVPTTELNGYTGGQERYPTRALSQNRRNPMRSGIPHRARPMSQLGHSLRFADAARRDGHR